MKGVYESFFMYDVRRRISREIPAIIIFCFLIGILFVIILRQNFSSITEYVEIFTYQLQEFNVSDISVFICILVNRLSIMMFVFAYSYFYRGKYCLHLFFAIFFIAYGMFLALNCLALGIKGLLTGFLFVVPQWLFYLIGFFLCIYKNMSVRSNRKVYNIIAIFMPFILILIGAIIECYVTHPLILKIL